MSTTRTFVVLEISKEAFDEIAKKLEETKWDHAFHTVQGQPVIDMHGIALAQDVNKLPKDDVLYERKRPVITPPFSKEDELEIERRIKSDNDFKRNQVQTGTKKGGEGTDRTDDSELPKRD